MAVRRSVRTSHWAFRGRCLYLARGWETALSSRGKPLVKRSATRKCVHESRLSISPTRPIVSAVLFETNAWHQEPKEIGHVESVLCAVSCLHLRLLSTSQSYSDQYGGWMWQADPFVAPGWPTGVGNTLRSFLWFRLSRRPSLLLVHPAPCVHITAGVGRTGSPAMPGSDHHNCVSVSLAFPLVWQYSNKGGTSHKEAASMQNPIPLSASGGRGLCVFFSQNLPLFTNCWLMT